MYLLGIDIGTSGTKTALFSESGELAASYTGEYPLYQPQNGYAEQEPEDWWQAVCDGIKAVLAQSGINPAEIAGIGLSGQMHGLVMLDEGGNVLRRSIIWCDQRTAKECEQMTAVAGLDRLMKITAAPAMTGFTASKLLWVRNNEPEIYEKCRHVLLPKDYIRFRLTGEFATEVSDASGMQLLDIENRCWSDELLTAFDIDRSLLARVYESPEITGEITAAAALKTGLKSGTPVVGGAGDNAAAAVGCAVVRDGRAFTTIGTSGVVFAHSSKMSPDSKGRIHTFCSAVPGEWHVMGVTQAAGLSLKWFRDNLCTDIIADAQSRGIDPYVIIDTLAAKSPAGANRLLWLPYLMGERTPHLDPYARGVFFGLSAMHTKADMLRAVMEGVTFSLCDCLDIFRENRINVGSMMACGGGGSSAFWRQMLADAFGCEVCTAVSSQGAALGAALLAGTGAGVFSDVREACDAVVGIKQRCSPDARNADIYGEYRKLYKQLYPALRESFSLLARMK